MAATEENIDQFVAYFRRQLQVVKSATFTENDEVYRKALYCSIIDALSTTMGATGTHRGKFTQAIQQYAAWPDNSRVSRPHLEKLLSRTTDADFDAVRHALAASPPFPPCSIVPISKDPESASIEVIWPREAKGTATRLRKIDGLDYTMLRHDQLLYSLRNRLIHESRTHGTTIPLPHHNTPYYHQTASLDTGDEWWTLIYPCAFVENVATNVLEGLENHYRSKKVDPYDFFHYGDYWFAQLNEP